MKKNYIYNLILTLSNILFPVLTFPYASHILGPEGIGKVQFVISFAMYFSILAALGIPLYGIPQVAASKSERSRLSMVFSELVVLYFIACMLLSVVYISIVCFVPFFQTDLKAYVTGGVVLYLGFTSIDWLYSGLEEFRIISIRSVAVKVLSVAFLYLFVHKPSDYYAYLLILVFSMLGNNIISLLMVGRHVKFTFKSIDLKRHIRPLFFILGTGLAASIYTILDTVLLGILANERSVGLYTAAVKLVRISIPLIVSFGTVLIPKVSAHYSNGEYEQVQVYLNRSYNFLILITVPVCAGLYLLAPEFIGVFSGPRFHNAIPSMRVLSVIPLLVGFGHLFSFQMLVPFGYGKQMFYASLGGVVCCLLLNILLVPVWKEFGASVANICSEAVVTVLYLYYVKKYYNFRFNIRLLLKAGICAALFVPTISLLRNLYADQMLILLTSVLFCASEYFLLQLFIFKNQLLVPAFNMMMKKAGIHFKMLT